MADKYIELQLSYKWSLQFKNPIARLISNHLYFHSEIYALKMPWTKLVINKVSLIINVKCCVCNDIKRKEKVLVIMWDFIDKHASKKKTPNGKWFIDPKCGHAKNHIAYVQLSSRIII
jgi:hypothetical protein